MIWVLKGGSKNPYTTAPRIGFFYNLYIRIVFVAVLLIGRAEVAKDTYTTLDQTESPAATRNILGGCIKGRSEKIEVGVLR